MRTKMIRALAPAIALALLAAACGDDDDADDTSASASVSEETPTDDESADEDGSSTVSIDMVDFGYEVSGPLATGVQTFETTNSGDEIHMMGIGKLKDGVTVDDVTEALSGAGEEGGSDERPEEDAETEAEGGEEDPGEDPFEALFDGDIGTPGHILLPGTTQKITLEDDLDVGTYALVCFIPAEGDGAPHFAKGMVGELAVVERGGDAEAPEADASYSLPDGAAPEGEATLPAGEVTLKVTNDGEIGKDFVVAQLDDGGDDIDAFDDYFVEMFEGDGPPPEGAAAQAPGTVAGSTFEIAPGQTIFLTVELTAGEWLLVNTNNVESDEGEEAQDFVLTVTAE